MGASFEALSIGVLTDVLCHFFPHFGFNRLQLLLQVNVFGLLLNKSLKIRDIIRVNIFPFFSRQAGLELLRLHHLHLLHQ